MVGELGGGDGLCEGRKDLLEVVARGDLERQAVPQTYSSASHSAKRKTRARKDAPPPDRGDLQRLEPAEQLGRLELTIDDLEAAEGGEDEAESAPARVDLVRVERERGAAKVVVERVAERGPGEGRAGGVGKDRPKEGEAGSGGGGFCGL